MKHQGVHNNGTPDGSEPEVVMEGGNGGVGLSGKWNRSNKRGYSGDGCRGGGSTVPPQHTGGVETPGEETEYMTQELLSDPAGSKQHKENPHRCLH